MADDNKLSFILDLDVHEFTEKVFEAKGSIKELGSKENLSELLEGLASVGPILATAGVAAYAFKKAIDLTLEGEQIERINKQFEILSQNVGISAKELKEGLEKAAGGLVDTTDLLKIANEALVKMGTGAAKLPELMELARKSTAVFGGDAKANFEQITNAIANGNVKQLASLGLKVDLQKAEKDFAQSIGATSTELNLAGKQQAVLNAVLEEGNKHFAGITTDSKSAATSLQLIKVAFNDIGETFTMAFEKTIGPGIRGFLGDLAKLASAAKLHVAAGIGDPAEKAAAKITLMKQKIEETEKVLAKLQATGGKGLDGGYSGENQARLKALPIQLEKYRAELVKLEGQNKSLEKSVESVTKAEIDGSKKAANAKFLDQEKVKKDNAVFNAELAKIQQATFNEQTKQIKTLEGVEKNILAQRLNQHKAHKLNLEKIAANEALSTTQKARLALAENARFQAQMQNDDETTKAIRLKNLDTYVNNSTTAFGGIEAAFRANTIKMQGEMKEFGKRGTETFNSLSSNATSAFTTMGSEMAKGKDVATATADAMRGLFLGVLADQASAQGKVMLLSGIWPPNPAAIAGGTALLVLGGVLKSLAGPSSAGSTIASAPSPAAAASGGGSAPIIAPISSGGDSQSGSPSALPQAQQGPAQRTVSVNISGNYLETDQTKRMLMDLMRQESDATGFNYNQIGA